MSINKLAITILTAVTAVAAAPAAMAMEDQATLPGKFTWIITDDISNQHPGVNLRIASEHYVSELRVTKNAAGKFVIRVTLPATLTGGQTVVSTYVQQSMDDAEIILVNPARADDYLRCNIRPTWAQVRCSDVTLKGVTAVPAEERESYAQGLYEGTPSESGMMVVAGAEPGGQIQFKNPEYEDVTTVLGVWSYTRLKADGSVETGTMRFDGYNGVFRADGSSETGLITNIRYETQNGEVHVDWYRDGLEGYVNFIQPNRSQISGESNLYQDEEFDSTWSAEQPQ